MSLVWVLVWEGGVGVFVRVVLLLVSSQRVTR